MTEQPVARLRLRKNEQRRVEAGHLWVFSNEIDTAVTPLKGLVAGAPVVLESVSGKFLGHGYANSSSLICARVTSSNKSRPFSASLLRDRINDALLLRQRLYSEPYYRLVFGEGDYLPGLVVDRYNTVLVVQITTAGMECFKDELVDCLSQLDGVEAIYLRNDGNIRELEQLPLYTEWAYGEEPEALQIRENGLEFRVSAELGQKTGWFYDHRDSRAVLRSWVKGKRVLDVYSYIGGFGLNAAQAGASEVLAIDASAAAVQLANENAKLNKLESTFTAQAGDAVESMRELFTDNQRFDVIALDPPAFIKRKKDRDAGLRHYALNNRLALKLLKPGGILLSASCSQALDAQALQQCVRQGMPRENNGLQLLQTFQQAPDHPVNISMPETLYLKGLIARLI